MPAYFNADKMPNPRKEYVCFIDIMGIQSKMSHSTKQSSNFIFKLHATLLEAWRSRGYNTISVYPIMDGAYITSTKKDDILNLLTAMYNSLSTALLQEDNYRFWYMVRASIAYGDVIHGRDIPYDACLEFSSRVGYKEQLLISPAMIEAYAGERAAAPMGIHICDSASSRRNGIDASWKWYSNTNIKTAQQNLADFKIKLQGYLAWLNENSDESEYPAASRQRHTDAAYDYFNIQTT